MTSLCWIPLLLVQGESPPIKNPYFETTQWRVWRLDETPVENVRSLVKKKGKEVPVEVTIAPVAPEKRTYPVDGGGRGAVVYRPSGEPSRKYAGMWDDVYASWSRLHGYLWFGWKGSDGSSVAVKSQVMHFAEMPRGRELARCGVNFVHQSTTGMGHTITNGYLPRRAVNFERVYFSDCLVTAPGHLSYVDQLPERCSDLYMALSPTIFHSLGSSNSETMAIDKMMIVGGYLPPETKLLLKRHGLYPAALLYLWKVSLPYRAPYDHELRHRVVYNSVGDRRTYPGGYNHAGRDRGDIAHAFHTYDDTAHMLEMVRRAKAMKVAPPEAILKVLSVEGGNTFYTAKKTLLVVQEKGEDVTVRVSAGDSYDLADRPLRARWTLLYGNRETTCERDGDGYAIRVPWDDALPEGRTAVALTVNNGIHDSNPAVINVYRRKGDLPPSGKGYNDYKVTGEFTNRRPALADLQDRAVRPGETVRIALSAIDPEGFPMRYFLRKGEPGTLDGNLYAWTCPETAPPGTRNVTIIASDGTSGNSYAGKRIRLHVAPQVFAKIAADRYEGTAPLTVSFSGDGSFDAAGDVKYGWDFYRRQVKPREKPVDERIPGMTVRHTFEKPGLYTASLRVAGPSGAHENTVEVLVTAKPRPKRAGGLLVEGNGARIRNGDESPGLFDHTDFGSVDEGAHRDRTYRLTHLGSTPLDVKEIRLEGAPEFAIQKAPRTSLDPGESTFLVVRFAPREAGEFGAKLTLPGHVFSLGGTCSSRP